MRQPELQRRFLVLKRSDVNSFRYDSGKSRLLADPLVTVVPTPLSHPWDDVPELRDLDRQGRLKPGTVFVRNPWDEGRYVESGEIYEQFQLAKYNAIAHVCDALGAQLLETSEIQAIVKGTGTPIKIGLGRPLDQHTKLLLGEAGVDTQTVERIRSQLEQRHRWDGGPPNRAKVDEWMTRTGLDADPAIRSLVQHRFEGSGGLREYTLVASISKEAVREVAFVAELGRMFANLLGSEFKIETGHTTQTGFEVQVRLHVKFSQYGVRAR
jgi:hypothetical protein